MKKHKFSLDAFKESLFAANESVVFLIFFIHFGGNFIYVAVNTTSKC